MYCSDCESNVSGISLVNPPTTCLKCSGSNISNIVEQRPCQTVQSPNGKTWDVCFDDSGSMIVSEHIND